MRVAIWTNYPNHYQRAFHHALRHANVDLRVRYYAPVPPERRAMGWSTGNELPAGDRFVETTEPLDQMLPDWRERIHIVPGYGGAFLLKLCKTLVAARAQWAHWSEPSRPGIRRIASWAIKRWYAMRVNRYALGAFGIGNAALRDFRRWGIRPAKMELLPYSAPVYPIDGNPDAQCSQFRAGRFAFLFLGSLNHRKGIDVLLHAFARVARSGESSVLILVGNDESDGRYAELAGRLGIADRVQFRGAIEPANIASVLGAADVFVLPSRFDGWGVALNEAALMGRALIATDRVGAAEHLISDGNNGRIVHAGNAEALASAMQWYASHPQEAAKHGSCSLQLAQDFTPQRNVQRFLHALETWRSARG